MARGVKTGGRRKGSINKVTAQQRAEAKASGLTPLEYMLAVLRDVSQPTDRRDEMAKAAAPYIHPKLTSVEGSLNLTHRHEEALGELE